MERINIPLNPMPDGVCRTIKNQYYKTSLANFMSQGSFGGTGVVTYIPPKDIGSHEIGGGEESMDIPSSTWIPQTPSK